MSANQTRYGFSKEGGVDWSEYIRYRPLYPSSFYERIFHYHERKAEASWATAHDVGAGAGIVSRSLSERFEHVVVSDPNDEYLSLARKLLLESSPPRNPGYTFWQKPAESCTPVPSGSVDLITACECIHYTDTTVSLDEFHRQLKNGGSLLLSYYARPRLPDTGAEKAWDHLFRLLVDRLGDDEMSNRALRIANSGLASIELPEDRWTGVRRVYINTHGSRDAFKLTELVGVDRIKADEEIEWLSDEAWVDYQGIDWLKAYISTWVPSIPEEDVRDVWDGIDTALGGKSTRVETPVAIVLATKKGTVEADTAG